MSATFLLASRRTRPETLARSHPGAHILDVTSRGPQPWVRFSPFFPHGGLPVPFSPGVTAQSVEGVWQGLKVFAGADVDRASFANDTMRGLKRTVRRLGAVQGHRRGVSPDAPLLPYAEARWQIYLPTYRWVLEQRLAAECAALQALQGTVVLLDYETNSDVDDLRRPLSHASLIIAWLAGRYPARVGEGSTAPRQGG